MTERGERYTKLMAPAFVEGLADVTGILRENEEIPLLGMVYAQQLVRPLLDSVDWEFSGLPDKSFGLEKDEIREKNLSPRDYAGRLMAYAFDDARSLMVLSEAFTSEHEPPVEVSFGRLLLNSRKFVVSMSEMSDGEKSRLLGALKTSTYSGLYLEEELEGPAMQYAVDDNGSIKLDWSDQISEWILSRKEKNRGCPANKMIVHNNNGRKQILTLYFWEKLVLAMHDV